MKLLTFKLATVGLVLLAGVRAEVDLDNSNSVINNNFENTHLGAALGSHNSLRGKQAILSSNNYEQILGGANPSVVGEPTDGGRLICNNHDDENNWGQWDDLREEGFAQEDRGCGHDEWGCSHDVVGKPSRKHIVSSEEDVVLTTIPVQALVTQLQTNSTADYCSESAATRNREDVETFCVKGNFQRHSLDVTQQCATNGECF